ncbi:MAG TPA: 4'-phosphopantetheinyl transferase superfamily protein [Thermoanaerobaculia bacterium]|nr:4'-phosphopantetheinyl transferase superfamily protein [Thermoanaerobaculia bacterium]
MPEEWRGEVCVVREVTGEDLALFQPRERERIASFPREKRRAEWAASRLAIKLLAVENGLCADPLDCSVDSAYRRPSLSIGGRRHEREVSITHSSGAGAAALSAGRIGIDLQKVRPLAERATKFFLNDDEVEAWRSVPLADSLIHFWCAKEAGYKLHAAPGWYRGVRVGLREVRREGVILDYRDSRSEGTIRTARLRDGFILALARMEQPLVAGGDA